MYNNILGSNLLYESELECSSMIQKRVDSLWGSHYISLSSQWPWRYPCWDSPFLSSLQYPLTAPHCRPADFPWKTATLIQNCTYNYLQLLFQSQTQASSALSENHSQAFRIEGRKQDLKYINNSRLSLFTVLYFLQAVVCMISLTLPVGRPPQHLLLQTTIRSCFDLCMYILLWSHIYNTLQFLLRHCRKKRKKRVCERIGQVTPTSPEQSRSNAATHSCQIVSQFPGTKTQTTYIRT